MAKKAIQKKEKIRQNDLIEEVDFDIDKSAFKGPFTCHGKTKLMKKAMKLKNCSFKYEMWQCPKCRKEYLDQEQSKKMERIWTIQKLMENKLINIKRKLNHDGKSFFFRFPAEFTKSWTKGKEASISVMANDEFLVRIIG